MATGVQTLQQLLQMGGAVYDPAAYSDSEAGAGQWQPSPGLAWMQGLASLPGQQFTSMEGDPSFDRAALDEYLRANGYTLAEGSQGQNQWTRGVFDAQGNPVIPVETGNYEDNDFWTAAQIAAAITGANIAAAGGAGAAVGGGGTSAAAPSGGIGTTASASSMPAVAASSPGIAAGGAAATAPAIASAPAIGAGVGSTAAVAAPAAGGGNMWGYLAANVASSALQSSATRDAARGQQAASQTAAQMQLEAQRQALEAGRIAQERQLAAQREALEMSLGEQRRQFDTTQANFEPWRTTGIGALEQLRALQDYDPTPTAASVMAEPGYQFGLTQGRDILEGSAAARGGLYSGRALRELTQYGNDYATTRYGDAWNREQANFGNRWGRLAGLAGVGQSATQQVSAAGQNMANAASGMYGQNAAASNAAIGTNAQNQQSILMGTAGNVGNIWQNNANAQAAARMQQGNIWANGLNQLAGMYMSNQGGGQSGAWNGYDFSGGQYRGG
jgi:hypothetical protein